MLTEAIEQHFIVGVSRTFNWYNIVILPVVNHFLLAQSFLKHECFRLMFKTKHWAINTWSIVGEVQPIISCISGLYNLLNIQETNLNCKIGELVWKATLRYCEVILAKKMGEAHITMKTLTFVHKIYRSKIKKVDDDNSKFIRDPVSQNSALQFCTA